MGDSVITPLPHSMLSKPSRRATDWCSGKREAVEEEVEVEVEREVEARKVSEQCRLRPWGSARITLAPWSGLGPVLDRGKSRPRGSTDVSSLVGDGPFGETLDDDRGTGLLFKLKAISV